MGKTKPPVTTPPGGPGKFSRRTDSQGIKVPGLNNPDIQYGDVGRLKAAQQIQPLPKPDSGLEPHARLTGEPTRPGRLPAYIENGPTNRPNEPVTTGLPTGPGPGPEVLNAPPGGQDIRTQVLTYLARNYGNANALALLQNMRSSGPQPPVDL